MNYRNQMIDRLLRSATQAREESPAGMPFGFDTRVVALWRAVAPKPNGVTSLLRGVAILSAAVIVISTLAAVREARQSRKQFGDYLTNEFAIADSAIHDEFLR
jgi:acid phosphatase family membrane protein YuiD